MLGMIHKWVFLILILFLSCNQATREFDDAFEFIAAADMRYYVANEDSTIRHFMGALQEIKKVGAGNFLISTGDIDPPDQVREAIDMVLGKHYPWYPVMGNHELEDVAYIDYLRRYDQRENGLVNLVRRGPEGCEETTYSFNWQNCHFVVLNQYYDGKSDIGTDGDVVPELLEWLEQDLAANTKEWIFVFGHEPIFPMPDMETGRVRHYDNSLNKYMDHNVAFIQLLRKHNVIAYICGHSHNTSYASINGLWQIDTGHCRGLEGISPTVFFSEVIPGIKQNLQAGQSLEKGARAFYIQHPNQKDIGKGLDYMHFTEGRSYNDLTEELAIMGLTRFYQEVQRGELVLDSLAQIFWKSANYTPSTFIKFYIGKHQVKADFYRDDGKGGEYGLKQSLILN